jgi:hypothetical protein
MKRLNLFGLAAAVTFGLLVPAHASAAAPTPDVPPAVTGTTTIGETLTTSDGTWGNDPTSFTYKWFRCVEDPDTSPNPGCTEITGADSTNDSYVLKTNPTNVDLTDTGKFIRAEVTATNDDGSASAFSNAVGPILSGTIPSSSFSMTPRSGSFFTNAFKAANWRVETGASAPNPPIVELLPTRVTTLKLPPKSQMTFNPGSMPVCPDSAIGPNTNNSVEIPTIVARCPNAVVGNGEATFLLNRVNNPNSTPPSLDGQVIAFNGGLVGGKPRVKFWAYSYDTNVAIYTQGILQDDGTLDLPIPQLTSDSAVNKLNVDLPGRTITRYLPSVDKTITIPGGKKADYVQAKCTNGTFPFSADFLLGRRTNEDVPIGDGELYTGIGSSISCTGTRAVAKLGKVTVKGPGKVKRNKAATYSVQVRNAGAATATGVRLAIAGKGVKISARLGNIAGGKSKTVKVKVRFKSKGKIKAKFNASSGNAGKSSATRTITVR